MKAPSTHLLQVKICIIMDQVQLLYNVYEEAILSSSI